MEHCCSQKWIYQRRVEVAVQVVMIVLSVLAVLILAFAPEERVGVSAQGKSQVLGRRDRGSMHLNLSNQPAINKN